MQADRVAIVLTLVVAMGLGTWYLMVRLPDGQWRRPHEAGKASMGRGQFDEAERQFATAAAAAHAIGTEDLRLACSLFHQADALVALDKLDDAIPLFEQALRIDEKVLGPEHPDVAPVLEHYAVPLRRTGRVDQARAAEDRARGIQARSAAKAPARSRSVAAPGR